VAKGVHDLDEPKDGVNPNWPGPFLYLNRYPIHAAVWRLHISVDINLRTTYLHIVLDVESAHGTVGIGYTALQYLTSLNHLAVTSRNFEGGSLSQLRWCLPGEIQPEQPVEEFLIPPLERDCIARFSTKDSDFLAIGIEALVW
jgi:hypothetical protein